MVNNVQCGRNNNIKKNTFLLENKIKNKKVKTPFSDGNLTNYSGIYPLFKFIKKMKRNHLFDYFRSNNLKYKSKFGSLPLN